MRPYVLLSAAMSADGYLDDASPRRLVLSGPEDLDRVDELRAGSDAVLVGAGTVRADDPRLLVRDASRRERRLRAGRPSSPVKVTLTASGRLDPRAQFFAADGADKLVYAAGPAAGPLRALLAGAATVIELAGGAGLAEALSDLAARGVGRLMIEGGSLVLGQALAAGLADELQLAVAPVFVADPAAPKLLAGCPPPARMRLAGLQQAGDVAVLRYLAGDQPGT